MAGAIIVIDQPGGAGAGSPGVARNDLWQNKQINLSCAVVNSTYQWDLLDVPPGSGASLTGGGTSTPYFLPDLIGTYRIQLITNGGGPGNVQILVIRVRYSATGVLQNRGWAPPGFGEQASESNYNGNVRGWAEVIEYILADIRTNGFSGGGGGAPSGPAGGDLGGTYPNPTVVGLTHVASDLIFDPGAIRTIDINNQDVVLFPNASAIDISKVGVSVSFLGGLSVDEQTTLNTLLVNGNSVLSNLTSNGSKPALLPTVLVFNGISGLQQTDSLGSDEKGAIVFDPSALFAGNGQITRTIRLVAVLQCAVAGQTCSLELFNITDGATVVTISTPNTSPTIVTSATLTVPASLPNSQKLYGLRLTRTGGTSVNLVSCKLARLEVLYS